MDDRTYSGIPSYAAGIIRHKASRLCRRPGFSSDERHDLEHDLIAHLRERLPQFDPARAQLNTFVARVIDRKVVSMIRHRLAGKRSPFREMGSLSDMVQDGDGRTVERHQVMPDRAGPAEHQRDLQHDIGEVLAGLPRSLRDVAVALGNDITINTISIQLNISRRAVVSRIAELRRHFEDAGLRDYL